MVAWTGRSAAHPRLHLRRFAAAIRAISAGFMPPVSGSGERRVHFAHDPPHTPVVDAETEATHNALAELIPDLAVALRLHDEQIFRLFLRTGILQFIRIEMRTGGGLLYFKSDPKTLSG